MTLITCAGNKVQVFATRGPLPVPEASIAIDMINCRVVEFEPKSTFGLSIFNSALAITALSDTIIPEAYFIFTSRRIRRRVNYFVPIICFC